MNRGSHLHSYWPMIVSIAFGFVVPRTLGADDLLQKRYNHAFEAVADQPGLPRVLLIGDSISVYYTVPTRGRLKGKANVHRIPVNGGNTDLGKTRIDEWLGRGRWDVIHFNWGLHDLIINPDGRRAVSLAQYENNLQQIVLRLKLTKATLIWATTTPVPPYIRDGPIRANDDVVAYNAAALRVMQRNEIRVDDLYSFVLPDLWQLQLPNNVHFNLQGSNMLAGQVARSILIALTSR